MLKNKPFLNGLGIGLIVGACLLQLAIIAQTRPDSFPAEEELHYNEQQLQEQIHSSMERQKEEVIKPLEEQLERAGQQLAQLQAQLVQAAEEQVKQEQERIQAVMLRIKPGMSASKVADELHKLQLVEDPEAFVQLAVKSGAKDKLRTGNYVFETKPAMETILEVLTTRPPN